MEPHEATSYWLEVLTVARAVDRVFEPCHLNYDVLGNAWALWQRAATSHVGRDPGPVWQESSGN
jgi:hypothetical protein